MLKGSVVEKRGILHTVITYTDENGVRKKKWQSTGLQAKGNLRKAEALLKERIAEMELKEEERAEGAEEKDIPFSQFLNEWLAMMKSSLMITTYGGYQYLIVDRINPYFDEKGMTVRKLKTKDIQAYYNTMLSKGRKWNTVVKHHAIIRKALDYAVKLEYIDFNPAVKIEPPKRKKFVTDYYNQDELNELFECVKGDLLEIPVILAAYYGLRRSEALGLKWSAIDFKEETLCIRHTVCQGTIDGEYKMVQKDLTKNKASMRTLPLIPEIKELLLETKAKQEWNRRKCRKSYCQDYLEYICVDDMGKLLKPNYVTEHLQLVLKKHGLKHIRFHDLRHSCASLLLANGISLKEIQEWLGHSDFGTTANIYGHLEYGAKLKSADKIAERLTLGTKKETEEPLTKEELDGLDDED